jgi:hypothetical protein
MSFNSGSGIHRGNASHYPGYHLLLKTNKQTGKGGGGGVKKTAYKNIISPIAATDQRMKVQAKTSAKGASSSPGKKRKASSAPPPTFLTQKIKNNKSSSKPSKVARQGDIRYF